MKLFDIIEAEYRARRDAAKQLLHLQTKSSELGDIFRKLQLRDEVSQSNEIQSEYDEYDSAIKERRFASYSHGIKYFEKYENYDVIHHQLTRKRVRPSDKNDQTVVVIQLKLNEDVTTLWWLPKRNTLTFDHEEGDCND